MMRCLLRFAISADSFQFVRTRKHKPFHWSLFFFRSLHSKTHAKHEACAQVSCGRTKPANSQHRNDTRKCEAASARNSQMLCIDRLTKPSMAFLSRSLWMCVLNCCHVHMRYLLRRKTTGRQRAPCTHKHTRTHKTLAEKQVAQKRFLLCAPVRAAVRVYGCAFVVHFYLA